MEKIIYYFFISISLVFIGCSSNSNSKKEEQNISKEIKPVCKLMENSPCTYGCIMLHATCTGGNIPIKEAYVIIDNQHKAVKHSDYEINDHLGFQNLQPNTFYVAEFTVILDGETLKDSIKIKTKNKEIPPSLVCKDSYRLYITSIDLPSDGTMLNLNTSCSSNKPIQYKIKSVEFKEGPLVDMDKNTTYSLSSALNIDKGKLKIKAMPQGGGIGVIIIQAEASGIKRDIVIDFKLQSLYF